MSEPRTLSSPKENVAETPVVLIQDAQTKIKQIIVRGYYENLPKQEIEKQIAEVIAQTTNSLPDSLKQQTRQALAISAQRWHFTYNDTLKGVNTTFIQNAVKISGKTFNLSVQAIAEMPASEQKILADKFRPYLTQDRAGLALIDNYETKVKQRVKVLANDPAYFTRVDKNGETYQPNLRNFAEMQVRYEANLEDVKSLKEEDVKLVWTSSHPDASPRCAPYQGRLWSLDGTKGTKDGISYEPLENALAGPRGDGNGIINGYNCRHRLIEYQSGSKAPREYDRATIRKENYITTKQREFERQIRALKTEEALAQDAKSKKAYSDEWQALNKRYQAFSLSNNRPFYDWRTQVTKQETIR